MGFNTAVIVLNDHIHDLEKDQQTGVKLGQLIRGKGYHDTYMSGVDCLPSVHADGTQIIAVGQNQIRLLTTAFAGVQHDVELLKELADNLGYRIVKKVKKNG